MSEPAAAQQVRQPTMPAGPTQTRGVLQRACACGKHAGNGGECAECRKKRLGLQRRAVGHGPEVAPPIVHEVLRSPGRPLDDQTRGFMESRFGHDFSRVPATAPSLATAGLVVGPVDDPFERQAERQSRQVMSAPTPAARADSIAGPDFSRVRVHTDSRAAESARAVDSLAYTVGEHVVFGAGRYAPGTSAGRGLLAHELTHVAQQSAVYQMSVGQSIGKHGSSLLIYPFILRKPAQPTLIKDRPGPTKRIEDAYGAGSLDQTQCRTQLDFANQEFDNGRAAQAINAYLVLYADVAKLAEADLVVTSSANNINVVTGTMYNCKDAKPGLNFSLLDASGWGARGAVGYVDSQGNFGVSLDKIFSPLVQVALVLSRSAFKPNKEVTLGVLRHEMEHAKHYSEEGVEVSDPKAKRGKVAITGANTQLLAFVEGFMTMFHLTSPAPTNDKDPAFLQLLGAISSDEGLYSWAMADALVRSEALGRLQEYYCLALNERHRDAFAYWVSTHLSKVRLNETSKSFLPGWENFFISLNGVIARQCEGVRLPMKLKGARQLGR